MRRQRFELGDQVTACAVVVKTRSGVGPDLSRTDWGRVPVRVSGVVVIVCAPVLLAAACVRAVMVWRDYTATRQHQVERRWLAEWHRENGTRGGR